MPVTLRRVAARAGLLATLAVALYAGGLAGRHGWAGARPTASSGAGSAPTAIAVRSTGACPPKRGRVLLRIGGVVVYHALPVGPNHLRRARACRAGVGALLLAHNSYYDGFGGPRAVAARGNEVAWVTVTRDDGADGDLAVLDVVARDLATAATLFSARSNGTRYLVRDGRGYSAGAVPAIVIAANGSVAWIACERGGSVDLNEHYDVCGDGLRSVWIAADGTDIGAPGAGMPRELARGSRIASRSLRVDASGSVLTWRQDGRRRSAPVSAGDASSAVPAS